MIEWKKIGDVKYEYSIGPYRIERYGPDENKAKYTVYKGGQIYDNTLDKFGVLRFVRDVHKSLPYNGSKVLTFQRKLK